MITNPILFTLNDGTEVHVKQITNTKFDFELKLKNGNRKTFIWDEEMPLYFPNKKGKTDELMTEAIKNFKFYL